MTEDKGFIDKISDFLFPKTAKEVVKAASEKAQEDKLKKQQALNQPGVKTIEKVGGTAHALVQAMNKDPNIFKAYANKFKSNKAAGMERIAAQKDAVKAIAEMFKISAD